MKIYDDFDELIYKEIAKKSGVKQAEKDVKYARFIYYHNPTKRYYERIDDVAFILGFINKQSFRIIGMATKKEYQGKGYGTFLLKRAILFCKKNGIKKITTRTLSGKNFYIKVANAKVVGKKDNDYLMEIIV